MQLNVGRPWRKTAVILEDGPVLTAMDRRVEPRSRIRHIILLGLGVTVLLATAAAGYMRFGLSRTLVVPSERVVISTVKTGMFVEYIPATASVAPRNTAYLDAVEGGQVAEVMVEEGAHVERGQPLVRLKNTNLQLEVLGRQAQLMEQLDRLNSTLLSFEQARLAHERDLIDAGAQIKQISERLRRRELLRASGAVSESEIAELTNDLERYRQLEASMREAQAVDRRFQSQQVTQLRDTIGKTRADLDMAAETLQGLLVKAPITGQLTALDAHLGEAKTAGQRIGQIDEADTYKVEAAIDEFYLRRVAVGQAALSEVDGHQYRLEITKVYPQVRERLFKVDLLFSDAPPQSLRRGQTLQVRLEIGAAHRSLLVANGPYYEDTGGAWVFVVSGSGSEAVRRPVRFGRRNPEQIEVLAGLADGARIITSSYESLRAFDRIRIGDAAD